MWPPASGVEGLATGAVAVERVGQCEIRRHGIVHVEVVALGLPSERITGRPAHERRVHGLGDQAGAVGVPAAVDVRRRVVATGTP